MDAALTPELSLAPSIIQPLLSYSGSSALQEALEILIETSRSNDGRSNLASKSILHTVLLLAQSLPHSSTCHLLLLSLRLLRNLCAGEVINQKSFIEHDGVKIVSNVISCVVLGCDDLDYAIVRTGLQVLANVSLGGERHQHAVWRQFFPEGFVEIARVRRKETSDPLCMIVYVCCDGSHEPFAEFCKEPGLTIMAEIVHTASTAGFGEDWMKLLLSRICLEETYFSPLFTMLSSLSPLSVGDIERRTANFASEQAYLLGIMSEILNERIREIHVCNDFVLHVLAIFRRAAGSVNFTSRGHSSLPTGCNSIDVLGYSLTILRDICARDSSMGADGNHSSGDVINAILSGGLLDLLLHLLGELELPLTIRKSMKQDENHSYTPPKVCPYKGFRRDIVSVIGNCAYRRKLVQDEIRQKSGILLLLQHCVSDEDDPFLREWSIWSVRNLLEGNAENQKVVADLELQGSVNVTEITGLGLRVEVDPNTGRVKLVNIS